MRLTNKSGEWIQIFLIVFFAFVVLVAIILLGIQKNAGTGSRESMGLEATDEYAQMFLISLLRTPVDADINGDHRDERVSLAELIVANKQRTWDTLINETISARVDDTIQYSITIHYSSPLEIYRPENDGRWRVTSAMPGRMDASVFLPEGIKVSMMAGQNNLFEKASFAEAAE